MEVHRVLGPGLLESTYETAMRIEFDDAGVKCLCGCLSLCLSATTLSVQ